MKKPLVFALLVATHSFAEPEPAPVLASAEATVQKVLLAPMAAKERRTSRLSREYRPPVARRLRVLDAQPRTDSQGASYVSFAVDARHGLDLDDEGPVAGGWRTDALAGCVYPESGQVFVKRGDRYVGATLLLGKKTPAAAEHVCREGEQVARK